MSAPIIRAHRRHSQQPSRNGYLDSIHVTEGQIVKAGDSLLAIDRKRRLRFYAAARVAIKRPRTKAPQSASGH